MTFRQTRLQRIVLRCILCEIIVCVADEVTGRLVLFQIPLFVPCPILPLLLRVTGTVFFFLLLLCVGLCGERRTSRSSPPPLPTDNAVRGGFCPGSSEMIPHVVNRMYAKRVRTVYTVAAYARVCPPASFVRLFGASHSFTAVVCYACERRSLASWKWLMNHHAGRVAGCLGSASRDCFSQRLVLLGCGLCGCESAGLATFVSKTENRCVVLCSRRRAVVGLSMDYPAGYMLTV